MRKAVFSVMDIGATVFGAVTSPALWVFGRYRAHLPMFQRLSDKVGFQLRNVHYYEPTYRDGDLPSDVSSERSLPGLDLNEAAQLELLSHFTFADELKAIPLEKTSPTSFGYTNNSYTYGDAEMLYNMVRHGKPRRIIEIGSGQSTLVVRLALKANAADQPGYGCEHICIEPYEAAWLEQTGVTTVRKRVEDVEVGFFDQLGDGDILFIDSSHVIRPFGDVLFEYQEIVPRLAPGVVVHVHDIFTPRDYLEPWLRAERKLWNEQYLLEAFLTYNGAFEVLAANNWLKHNHFEAFARACPTVAQFPGCEPGSFWFRRKPAAD